eukprot:GEMP01004844.1.p1 GENE.GEMP01004844.1~~GEMP01004844.1.p1  ORF type:complete len:1220 (+),score=245.97 GEMP01004844.1:145-3804(+)
MASFSSHLLEDMENWDKDKRFMAAIDLTTEINNNSQGLELHLQKRICYAFLKQLDDQSVEVQGNAVKCLAKIVCRLDMQIAEVVAKLSILVLDGKAEVRDIYATCLKGLLSELPKSASSMVCQNILPKMLQGIVSTNNEVKEECTDVLCDLLKRFGDTKVWWNEQEKITLSLLSLLGQQYKSSLRKKASVCIGIVSSVVSDRQLDHICKVLLQEVRQARSKQEKQTYIQCIGIVSKNVGGRIGPHLENIPALLLQICRTATADVNMSDSSEDYEVVELCLNAFESFVVRCPKEISKHLDDLSKLLLSLLSFDPNLYQTGDMNDQDDVPDSDDDYGDSEDDDSAWKVRRAALKCIASLVKTGEEERLEQIFGLFTEPIIHRFSAEREENVKLDSFCTFQSMIYSALTTNGLKKAAECLVAAIPQAIQALQKQLRGRSLKVQQGAIATIKVVAEAMPHQLEPCLVSLEHELTTCLKAVNNSIRLDAITILYQCSGNYRNPDVYQQLAPTLFPLLLEAVDSGSYYTIIASALRACGAFVNPLRPEITKSGTHVNVVLPLFQIIKRRLESTDIDQEVKERGLECLGMLLARIGDLPPCLPHIRECLPPFVERMRNEVTRATAIRALKTICDSPIHVPIEENIPKVVQFLCEYLHKKSRSFRQLCLDSFVSVTRKYGTSMDAATHSQIVQSVAQYIAEDDLYLTDLAVQVMHNSFSVTLPATNGVLETSIQEVLKILRSPLLQGGALESILQLLSLVARKNPALASELFNQLADVSDVPPNPQGARQTIATLARCLALFAVEADSASMQGRISSFLSVLSAPVNKTNLHQVELSTLALGEMGKKIDLSTTKVCDALMAQLSSPHDDLCAAAALALGMCSLSSVGAMGRVLKEVVDQICVTDPKTQYLLLTSLREVISFDSQMPNVAANLETHVPNVLPIFKQFASSSEEGVRHIVAECLGSLLVIHQAIVLETLLPMMQSSLWQERMVAVSSLRFAAKIPKCSPITLEPLIPHFLHSLSDEEVGVRKSGLQSVNVMILSPSLRSLLREHTTLLLERCAEDSKPRPNLVREVDLGPFKHKVDDGLPLRKFAYNVTTSLIAAYPDKFPLRGRFMDFVLQGFQDGEDIQALSCQLLSDLCCVKDQKLSVDETLVEKLGDLLDPFDKCVMRAIKQIQAKQQVGRANDTLRLYVRTLKSVETIAELARHKAFLDFLTRLQKDPVFSALW